MAMPFGCPALDVAYGDHFKKAVNLAGFGLETNVENQPLGPIDDSLRVKIRRSRFLVAELSEANQGVYFEAGYAEGLGRAVFYTCNREWCDEQERLKKRAIHFDVRQQKIVFWKYGTIADDLKALTATIRLKVPDAKQSDG